MGLINQEYEVREVLDDCYRPYEPRGGALELFYCRAPEVLIEGPVGTGKTRAVLEKLFYCATTYPGMRALVCRKQLQSLLESVLVTFEEKVAPPGHPILRGERGRRVPRQRRRVYQFPNGSEIVVGGLQRSMRVMSTEYDMIAVFEATELTEEDWDALTTRLRNGRMPFQQLIGDCNPSYPGHWLNQRCKREETYRILSRHGDNPAVTRAYLERLTHLAGARRKRLVEGIWARQEGLVYDFDPALHLVEPFAVPPEWRRVRSIDFGYRSPAVCQWWAIAPTGEMILYREIYRTRTLTADMARRIVELSQGEKIEATVADWSVEENAALAALGIPTIPAFKDIGLGIQGVRGRLADMGNGCPGLLVMRGAPVELDPILAERSLPASTLDEFEHYAWPGEGEGHSQREVPVKEHDHGMDAMRYAVAYVDNIGNGRTGGAA